MPFQKGHPSFHTEESRRKISEAHKGKKPKNFEEIQRKSWEMKRGVPLTGRRKIGWKLSEETKKRISENSARIWLGKTLPLEVRKKISLNLLGKYVGEKNPLWKGDSVGYNGLHHWVYKHLRQPDTCEFCKKSGLKGHQIHWANKSGKYKRALSDWFRLCAKCHSDYDRNKITI